MRKAGPLRLAAAFALAVAVAVAFVATRGSACAATVAASFAETTGSLSPGTVFYTDSNTAAGYWDRTNPGDPREPAIASRIAVVPQALWFTEYNPAAISSQVTAVTQRAAAAGAVPVLVLYNIPVRNCSTSAGNGAPTFADYESWVDAFSAGLGGHRVVVIVEPDALALQTCLSAQSAAQRDGAIAYAGASVRRADASAKVYFDAGNSAWNSAADQAARLAAAHVTTDADGIASNVSNFRPTADEVAYDEQILADLGDPANLHIVVDTSRNGSGPGSTWCDPSGRTLGRLPTANTGNPRVDAYLWVKDPGQADGCAAPAGAFDPALAYALIANGGGYTLAATASPTASAAASPAGTGQPRAAKSTDSSGTAARCR